MGNFIQLGLFEEFDPKPGAPTPPKSPPKGQAPAGSTAYISIDGLYRYDLTRPLVAELPPTPKIILCAGLNPSKADALRNDKTIDMCTYFARREGGDLLVMLNLYAWRATEQKEMWAAETPIGIENDAVIRGWAEKAHLVIAAWGALPKAATDRMLDVVKLLRGTTYLVSVRVEGAPAPLRTFPPFGSMTEANAFAQRQRESDAARGMVVEVKEQHARDLHCLGLTNDGFPRHPSRLAHATPLVPFVPAPAS